MPSGHSRLRTREILDLTGALNWTRERDCTSWSTLQGPHSNLLPEFVLKAIVNARNMIQMLWRNEANIGVALYLLQQVFWFARPLAAPADQIYLQDIFARHVDELDHTPISNKRLHDGMLRQLALKQAVGTGEPDTISHLVNRYQRYLEHGDGDMTPLSTINIMFSTVLLLLSFGWSCLPHPGCEIW